MLHVRFKTKCIRCTRALNKNINGETVTPDQLANYSMEHDGPCYRTKDMLWNPSNSEEYQAEAAAKMMLLNENGEYRGDDEACFIGKFFADNDTSGPNRLIAQQNKICGEASDNLAEYYPDIHHVIKNNNNGIHEIKSKDSSFNGKYLLSNERIVSLSSDLRQVVEWYHEDLGNAASRQRCIDQIKAIVPHHCGDHSGCKEERFCTYVQIKNEHEDWTHEQIQAEFIVRTNRHEGKAMQLSEYGIEVLQNEIFKRFNPQNIDRIAEMGCSNACEGFWGEVTQFSEGKRLNMEHTDYWLSMLHFTFCKSGGNQEKTHQDLAELLNVVITPQETKVHLTKANTRRKMYLLNRSEAGKRRRKMAKLTNAFRTGKDDAKKRHKSEKVDLRKSGKASVKAKKCQKCGDPDHTTSFCNLPKLKKRGRAELVDWFTDESEIIGSWQPSKKRKPIRMIDWCSSD